MIVGCILDDTDMDMVGVDLGSSTLILGGRNFPACAVVIEPTSYTVGIVPDPSFFVRNEVRVFVEGRTVVLGGPMPPSDDWNEGWGVYLPAENGCLICVLVEPRVRTAAMRHHTQFSPAKHGGFTLSCVLSSRRVVEPGPTLDFLHVNGGKLVEIDQCDAEAPFQWVGCEVGWLCEHIDRVSRMPVQATPCEIPVRLVPIGEAFPG